MKNLFIPFIAFAILCSCSDDETETPLAPLEITKVDFMTNYKTNGTPFTFFNVNPTDFILPIAGANQTWDFSLLAETSSDTFGGSVFTAAGNTAFPTASYSYLRTEIWSFGGAVSAAFPVTQFDEVSDSGFYDIGLRQNVTSTISVPSLGAVISFPIQNLPFTGTTKFPNVLFPVKMGDAAKTTAGIVFTNNFTVNAPALGLNNTPGQLRLTTSLVQEVIASGTANLKGIGTKRVLVTKTNISDVSNYFLGGAPAPAVLLSTLGVVDGNTTTRAVYRVIAEGIGNVGFIDVNANGVVIRARFRKG